MCWFSPQCFQFDPVDCFILPFDRHQTICLHVYDTAIAPFGKSCRKRAWLLAIEYGRRDRNHIPYGTAIFLRVLSEPADTVRDTDDKDSKGDTRVGHSAGLTPEVTAGTAGDGLLILPATQEHWPSATV